MKRVNIFLRLDDRGGLERSRDKQTWIATGLSKGTIYDAKAGKDFAWIIQKFADVSASDDAIARLCEILPVSAQKAIGAVVRRGLFGDDEPDPDLRWLHLVPHPPEPAEADKEAELIDLVCRMPWIFLTGEDRGQSYFYAFRRQRPLYVTVDAAPRRAVDETIREVKFPPQPRILLAVTDPRDDPTFGRRHETELKRALLPDYSAKGRNYEANLKFVRSYADFTVALVGVPGVPRFDPDIIYFYGHGYPGQNGVSLRFETPAAPKQRGKADSRPIEDIQALLVDAFRESRRRPVVWINACFGAASPGVNALTAFSEVASCVITSRTAAAAEASGSHAVIALPVLAAGFAPPFAVWKGLHNDDQTLLGARWATTVISVQYEIWSALDTEERKLSDRDSAGDFPRRLDRRLPLQTVERELDLLSEKRRLAFLWSGTVEDSVQLFKERVEDRLSEYFRDRRPQVRQIELQSIRPDVPAAATATGEDDPHKSGEALRAQFFLSVFCGLNLIRDSRKVEKINNADIADSLERIAGGDGAVLFLGHGPLSEPDPGAGDLILRYIAFWDGLLQLERIKKLNLPIILGFTHSGESELALQAPQQTIMQIPLEPVDALELQRHFEAYNDFYSYEQPRLEEIAKNMVDQCDGKFRRIHLQLEAKLEQKFQSDDYYKDATSRGT